MFANTITLTRGTTDVDFYRLPTNGSGGVYTNEDGSLKLEIFQNGSKSTERYSARLTAVKVGPDLINPAVNRTFTKTSYVGASSPMNGVGFTDTEADELDTMLSDWWESTGTRAALRRGEA